MNTSMTRAARLQMARNWVSQFNTLSARRGGDDRPFATVRPDGFVVVDGCAGEPQLGGRVKFGPGDGPEGLHTPAEQLAAFYFEET